jgi:hypothetical protein
VKPTAFAYTAPETVDDALDAIGAGNLLHPHTPA